MSELLYTWEGDKEGQTRAREYKGRLNTDRDESITAQRHEVAKGARGISELRVGMGYGTKDNWEENKNEWKER